MNGFDLSTVFCIGVRRHGGLFHVFGSRPKRRQFLRLVLLGFVGWSFELFFVRRAGERHWPSLFAHALWRRAAHRDWLLWIRPTTNHFSGLWIFALPSLRSVSVALSVFLRQDASACVSYLD
ncbi:MAG: hypothetical protein WBS33_04485 [Verrucomicrobiia bacterium]